VTTRISPIPPKKSMILRYIRNIFGALSTFTTESPVVLKPLAASNTDCDNE
jgi:hypothetical protein